MNTDNNITFASVEAILTKSAIEFDRKLAESQTAAEKRRAEFEQEMKRSREGFEQEMKQSREGFEQEMKRSREDFDRRLAESSEKLDRDLVRMREEFDNRMKKQEDLAGSWNNNFGAFAEEYFFNSFANGKQNFFGEKFDEIEQKVKGIKKGFKDEYDILLINGQAIGIVETKFKAHQNDVPKILRKADTFRVNFPEYKNHRVYLGLATLSFYPELEQECEGHGIAIIKQVGDVVVINDKNLKVF